MPRQTAPSRRLPWYRKLVYALIPTFLVLGSGELLLTAIGVQPVTQDDDPFVGFAGRVPLFSEQFGKDGQPWMETTPSKLVWFNQQSFTKKKAAGTQRIFCLGGSTTFGRPYSDPVSYSGWMRELLPKLDASTQWEVINAGGVSYASYRVAAVMQELVAYEPDLFIVYSVHNEFLERRTYDGMFRQSPWSLAIQSLVTQTRTFAVIDRALHGRRDSASQPPQRAMLPAEVDERLNHTVGPADYYRDLPWNEDVVRHYESNLRRMVAIAERAGAQVIFITPTVNLRNCSPFKSEMDAALSPEQQIAFETHLVAARSATNSGDFAQAVEQLQLALSIDVRHADAHYLLGRALFSLGRFDEAGVAFQRAVDEDICPLRATTQIDAALRRVADETQTALVDFGRLLSQKCRDEFQHELLGEEYFLDHVHPNMEIHRELAIWIIEELKRSGWRPELDLNPSLLQDAVAFAQRAIDGRLDREAHGVAFRNLAKVLHWAGKFEEAAPRARDALELLPGDPESRLVLADCLKNLGDIDGAILEYASLLEDYPDYPRSYLPYGCLLAELDRLEQAKAYLMLAVLYEPDNAYAHFVLGGIHYALGEASFAVDSLSTSLRLAPDDPTTLKLLDLAKVLQGETNDGKP